MPNQDFIVTGAPRAPHPTAILPWEGLTLQRIPNVKDAPLKRGTRVSSGQQTKLKSRSSPHLRSLADGISWKIDYRDMQLGSEDPSDPAKTTRILTRVGVLTPLPSVDSTVRSRRCLDNPPSKPLDMKCPAQVYAASTHRYGGLPELTYPFHDRDVLVRACGSLCLHRKRINISSVLAGQRLGIKEVDEGIWLVSFTHYDLDYFDLEQKTLQPLNNPFGARLSPMS